MNFSRRQFFGFFLLILGRFTLRMYVSLPLLLPLLRGQRSGIVCALLELGGQNKSFSAIVCHFIVKVNLGVFFLKDYGLAL